jgi:hypothetical protein
MFETLAPLCLILPGITQAKEEPETKLLPDFRIETFPKVIDRRM